MKICPQCSERIQPSAKLCRFCNYRFSDHELAATDKTRDIANLIKVAVVVAILLFVISTCQGSGDDTSNAPPVRLSEQTVSQCRELISLAERQGLIRARPASNRINVEDRKWAATDAATKDRLLQAVACDVWQTAMPPGMEHVVAYGHRSGRRLQMLTSVGMSRE